MHITGEAHIYLVLFEERKHYTSPKSAHLGLPKNQPIGFVVQVTSAPGVLQV